MTSRFKFMIYGFLAVGFVFAGVSCWMLTARSSYESAPYELVDSDGTFEIREYPDLMLVTTGMQPKGQADNGSFMRLYRYIDRQNEHEQKIPMTTPVFMEWDSDGKRSEMAFVLPQDLTDQKAPAPANEMVRLQRRSAGRFAVLRFSGRLNANSVDDAKQRLREWMNSKGLTGIGDIVIAGYDPPWTPGPFRRNEVLMRLR